MSDRLQTETALVLFSGGQDSATCLAWALEHFARVEMLGLNTGSVTPSSLIAALRCSMA